MRVAYICADPGIPVFGTKGASVHVQEVIKGMLQRGLDVTLFAQRLGGEPPSELKEIKIRTLPELPNHSATERAALAANKTVEQKHSWLAVVDRVLQIATQCKTAV